MRKLAGIAALAAVAFGATAVMAASPSPSASPRPSASPSAMPSASPSAKPSASRSASPSASPSAKPTTKGTAVTNDWTASVAPVDITGTVKVHESKSGAGTVTFKLNEILNETVWSIRIDRGTFEGAASRTLIAGRTGDDVRHFLRDTISIHLTRAEMKDFRAALKKTGVVVFISDGSRLSIAKFPPM